VCVAEYGREHYACNRQAYITRNVANMRERRRALKERVWGYLADQACIDCGERDLVVLDFDHIERERKRLEIYWLAHSTFAWSAIEAEIEKCEVRCANCHRVRTAAQFDWVVPTEVHTEPRAQAVQARLQRPIRAKARAARPTVVPHGHLWCESCGCAKPLHEFYATNHSMCAECFRAYRREHYALNRDAYIERNTRVLLNRQWAWYRRVWNYLSSHPCVDCGHADPRVLEFDHRDRKTKVESVSVLAHRGGRWANIEAEIRKCDVRCANCHRRRTATQFNWRKRLIRAGR
jgi:hypothetical protein